MNEQPGNGPAAAPRLSVSILTRNSAQRLAGRIGEARRFADEIVVGVDAASTDGTFEVASALADVVFHFRLPAEGQMAPARLHVLKYATGDWILSLDDDEGIEEAFDALLPELMARSDVTHYHFPRKTIVSLNPCEYVHAPPWFPDWQLRLFRNDPSLVWKPQRPHSGYQVAGLGFFESRACLLHFEPIWCSPEEHKRKTKIYQKLGVTREEDDLERSWDRMIRYPTCLPPQVEHRPRSAAPRIDPEIRTLTASAQPPWNAVIVSAAMPHQVARGAHVVVEVRVCNTGRLCWWPITGRWPTLNLSFHLLTSEGKMLQRDGQRMAMPRIVQPGEEVVFLGRLQAPSKRGDYLLEWDMVSEGECWFAACGSTVLRTPLRVI